MPPVVVPSATTLGCTNRKKHHLVCNRCNTIIWDSQRRHIQKSVENGDPANVWGFWKSLGWNKAQVSKISNVNLNLFNIHFSTTSRNLATWYSLICPCSNTLLMMLRKIFLPSRWMPLVVRALVLTWTVLSNDRTDHVTTNARKCSYFCPNRNP